MQRYLIDQPTPASGRLTLPSAAAHHLVTVMRATPGSQFELAFNDRRVFVATLTAPDPATARLESELAANNELPLAVTLACGLPKTKEKPEWIVQKATELGARRIVFFAARRSIGRWPDNRRTKRLARLNKIATGAAEQSHRALAPTVDYAPSLAAVLRAEVVDHRLVAWEESAKQGEQRALAACLERARPGQSLLAVFGPEGGLTDQEAAAVVNAGGVAAGLGPRILRTETAPLYLLAAVSYQFELLGD